MYFSFTTIQYYMQMSNRQIRSRKFIVGVDQVVLLTTADNSDSSDGDDPIDEKDIFFLKKLLQKQALKMRFWLLLMMLEQTHKFQLILPH